MKLVIFGLTVSSSWGNGHATLWRGLWRALVRRGHRIVFFERDVPYYAGHRDLTSLPGGELVLYHGWDEVVPKATHELADADVAMVTSYCPDGIAAADLVLDSPVAVKTFYDLDTPITFERLRAGETVPYLPPGGLGDFDLVLSYTGGAALNALRSELGARRVAPLYGSVDPEAHCPVPAVESYRADLSYLGTYAADRQQAVERLLVEPARQLPNKRFVIGGAQYPHDFPWTENIHFVRHMPPPEHPAFFCSSRLTLNVTRRPMAEMGHCPSGRLFEAAACGTPVLSDWWAGLDAFFEPDKEILIARSTDDAVNAIELSDAELGTIARAARERTLNEHTADHRARELEEALECGGKRHIAGSTVVGMLKCLFAAIALVGAAGRAGAAAAAAAAKTVSTDDTLATITIVNDRPALSSLRARAEGREWVAARGVPMGLIESAQVQQREVPLHWRFVREAASDRPVMHDFQFGCDEPSLELHSIWSARPGPGPIEHQIIIQNRGQAPVMLPIQASLEMTLQSPAGHALEQWWVEKGAGTPTAQGVHRIALEPGREASLRCWPSGRDSPRDAIPWMTFQDVEAKQGWYTGIELTARTRVSVTPGEAVGETRPVTVRIGLQEDPDNRYFTRVGPGERFETPKVFIGCYGGDVDDGANRLHRWVRTNLTPATRDAHYPVLVNNSWGSGMAVDERLARKMIDESAELGLELFHIDAGWFRTVGDWRPNEKKFPRGLGPVADYAHERGLKFGLWVGWTQGGDQVDPTGEHRIMSPFDPTMADWFYQDFPKNWKAGEFTGATACLGDPKVVDWCLDQLRGIVKQDKLDLLEHDQTVVLDGCAHQDHLHTRSPVDVGYRAALGYYHVYDTLRAKNPDLLFENCVNGGHMVDYGAVQRCHYISITDTYDPLSNRRAFYDASYALPPAMCECYIENVAVRSVAQFKAMLRSGMMGWCTIMTDTSRWTPEQHAAAKQQFALYKAKLRPLIREADLYHVSERPDGVRWDGIQYFDPRTGDGAVFAFRGKGQEEAHTFKLKGLEAGARYAVSFEDGSGARQVRSGDELMKRGIEVKLAEAQSSEIVYLKRE